MLPRKILIWALRIGAVVVVLVGMGLGEFAIRRRRPMESVRDADRVEIRAGDGLRLRASFRPAARGRSGKCVLVVPGVGASRTDMPGLMASLQDSGFDVLATDSRAHGESDGALVEYGVAERHDVVKWVDWLSAGHCPHGVNALGISMGASIVLQTLPIEPRIRAAVAESSFYSFSAIGHDRVGQMIPPMEPFAWPVVLVGLSWDRLRYGVNLAEASPAEAAPRIEQPVLLIHGTADDNVVLRHSQRLLPLLKRGRLWVVEGARHAGCYEIDTIRYMQQVESFFGGAGSR